MLYFVSWAGMPFYQAVNILRRQDRYIKGVQVWYSDQVSHKKLNWFSDDNGVILKELAFLITKFWCCFCVCLFLISPMCWLKDVLSKKAGPSPSGKGN